MPRAALMLAVIALLAAGGSALAENEVGGAQPEAATFDLGSVANRMFGDLALLPTRLTSYNSHDDAATASYTCCKPSQEVEIERALKANADFVRMYPTSDFADDALFHSGYVNGVKRDMLHQIEAYALLAVNYPDSPLWDDAMWNLAQCYARDKDRPAQIDVLNRLIEQRPHSLWADDACLSLAQAYVDVRDEDGSLRALQMLATDYRSSEFCDDALFRIAQRYQTLGSYQDAIAAYDDLLRTWPMSDYVDDAQFGVAQSFRATHNLRDALPAYEFLINSMPGSPLVRQAMAEVNTMRDGTYDLQGHFPCDDAEDLWDLACHYQNYRQFSDAIAAFTDFVRAFPGHDNYDDAWFNIGVCYQDMNRLFQKINEAKGPEDLFRFADEFRRGTGGLSTIPTDRQLTAVGDAVGAFAVVVNNLVGSNLRDKALREIARSYEHSNLHEDAAFTYQEKLMNFPYETEPDEGDMRGKGALVKTLRYYADPAHYADARDRYMLLARAHPDVFPAAVYEDKEQFLALMSLYRRHAEHDFYEMERHIPQRLSIDDLRQDARFYLACLNMERGEHKSAINLLKPFFDAPTSDFSAPGAFVFARANEIRGEKKTATQAYQWILDVHGLSGLADDAQDGLARLEQGGFGEDLAAVGDAVERSGGARTRNYDVWLGKDVVVVAPWVAAAKMRQYNMPNIWDEAQRQLCSWTGAASGERQIVLAASGAGAGGNVVVVDPWQISDPPAWSLGLTDMARNAVVARGSKALGASPVFVGALAKFGAAALQYQLVTETRDTIGSASAVKLPQEEVIRARDGSLKALEEYVRQEPDPSKLNDDIVAGMLYTLLDSHGYGKHSLIDWAPYSRFFEAMCREEGHCNVGDSKQVGALFVKAMSQAFGADCGDQFATWGFPVDRTARVGALPH
ncbi:MAG: tetratricopeptide repeat protein [Armatimonadetes bacterium]|nr:tetratricopeptide repeat protein [Armatimonadota bacterium]